MGMKFYSLPYVREMMVHKGAIIAGASVVDGQIHLHCVQDTDNEKVKRGFTVARDGGELPEAFNFVATVRMQGGALWHVLDLGEETSGSDAFKK